MYLADPDCYVNIIGVLRISRSLIFLWLVAARDPSIVVAMGNMMVSNG